jgi:hypothetical protein
MNLVAAGLTQHLFHYPPEACGKRSASPFREVGGAGFEKETVTAPPQSTDSE